MCLLDILLRFSLPAGSILSQPKHCIWTKRGRINSLCLHVYGDRKEGRTAFRCELYKNIKHTVRFTELTSKRFDQYWKGWSPNRYLTNVRFVPLADICRGRLTTNRRDIQRYMQRKNLCTRVLLISRITSNSRHGSDYIMLITQDLWDRNVLDDKVTTPRINATKRIRQKTMFYINWA